MGHPSTVRIQSPVIGLHCPTPTLQETATTFSNFFSFLFQFYSCSRPCRGLVALMLVLCWTVGLLLDYQWTVIGLLFDSRLSLVGLLLDSRWTVECCWTVVGLSLDSLLTVVGPMLIFIISIERSWKLNIKKGLRMQSKHPRNAITSL